MRTGAELGQYFCADAVIKSMSWIPLTTLWVRQCTLIPKWLWCKTNLVLNLTSRVPVNYYYWRVIEGLLVFMYCSPAEFSSWRGHLLFNISGQNVHFVQGGPKNWHTLYALTSSNIGRFSNLFHCPNHKNICNNTITKDPTTPQVCRYTNLW